ncbi:MAG: glutamyl-tRNA amidotransferase [Rhodobacterales bacterium 17-64-5]|nr:MAG: glutamyl-tRNA amidotransferase [Rhodobacterales bacterium 17-64-5]
MALRDGLMAEIKEAMKAKAADRLSALRLILNGLKEREIALRGEGTAMTEADELTVLAKMVKQRQESVKVYLEGARQDLADKESAEIRVIEEFLPKQLSPAEVEAAVVAAIAETGAASVKDMGRVMAVLKGKYTGQMDFGAVGALIKARLA